MTEEAREAARREFYRTEVQMLDSRLNFNAGWGAGVAEGIRQAREAVEAARPTTYDLNWAWRVLDALESEK